MLKSQEGLHVPPGTFPVRVDGAYPHCACEMLNRKGDRYDEIELGSNGISHSALQAVSGRGTTPQVYGDGQHIDGADELSVWLANSK